MTTYQERIAEVVADIDPRFVEGMMRSYFGTLDHLSRAEFVAEAKTAAECCREDTTLARAIAKSYGLYP